MARIHLLDETLANQIAAGEVIERPAAVVKELVENALDAGATRIDVDLQEGGRRLVRVRDDGCGMSREDAGLSLQRHATSKLRSKEDLFGIRSYGFRGEALPSMAAVSRFTLLTCERDASQGTRVEVDGGAAAQISAAGAPPGTTVEVRDLFWNVPARRKFLKRAQAEQAQCLDAVLRLALPRGDVTFTVRDGERILLQLHAREDALASRAEEALGREVRGNLVPFEGEQRGIRASGLAVSPALEYGSARNVWLFVNGRAIRDRSLTHAVLRAYGELMPHGRYPGALVFVEVPPAEVDVNVHPAKAEVRLADARAAWDAIHTGLIRILARGDWMPTPPPSSAQAAAAPPSALPAGAQHVAEAITRYGNRNLPATWWMPPAWGGAPRAQPAPPELMPRPAHFKALRYLGQLHRTYLVCEGPQGLVLIDQHAAHERMNYQRLRGRAGAGAVQPLLVPQVVALSSAAFARVSEASDLLASIGLETEPFGETAMAVKTLPPPLARLDEQALAALLADLSDELSLHGRGESLSLLRDALLARAACHGSVRAHDPLTPQEAQALLDALDETDYGARCAHGRPVVADFDRAEIERRFGRDYASHSHAAPEEAL
ncbi:MAG TPA: DNA mismatch repair endonuclease MutL [Myxococcales bacterium]|nr:DNA mismatch repair endonuclease MutL [Myxococcales bacterium]